jgi:hypothetical protein
MILESPDNDYADDFVRHHKTKVTKSSPKSFSKKEKKKAEDTWR